MDHLCMKCGICESEHCPMCYSCGGGEYYPATLPVSWYAQEIERLKRRIQTLEDELRSHRRHICPNPWNPWKPKPYNPWEHDYRFKW